MASSIGLADGFHRVQAAHSAGVESLDCVVKEGGLRDAVLYSCGANATHGIQRTNEDKRRVVMKLLQDDEWKEWSARAIAEQCRVTHTFVNKLREQMTRPDTGNVSSMDAPSSKSAERTYIHPKTRKPTQMKTGGIGKRNRVAESEKDTSAKPATTVSQAGGLIASTSETEEFKREHLVRGMRTFAAFCRANSATSVAVSIPPNEVEEIRVSAARIYEWLGQFAVAMDRVEETEPAAKREGGPPGPDNAPSADRQPPPATSTSSNYSDYPDLPVFLDRRAEAQADASKPRMET